jgi:hypothetical protein
MPNPYLPYFHDKRYSLGFDALNSRPKFEAAIGRCIGIWSYVDEALGSLFGILLGTESIAAHKVFLILRAAGQTNAQLSTRRQRAFSLATN